MELKGFTITSSGVLTILFSSMVVNVNPAGWFGLGKKIEVVARR